MSSNNTTVTSADDYTIVVDGDGTGTHGSLQLRDGDTPSVSVLKWTITGNSAFPGTADANSSQPLIFRRSSAVDFHMTGTGDAVSWRAKSDDISDQVASLTEDSELDISRGSLRLPVRNSLSVPLFGNPVEGEMILLNRFGTNARIAVYLNGGWRFSAWL